MLFSCQIKNTDTVSHTTLNMENYHQEEPNVTESAVFKVVSKEKNVEMDHNDMHDISTDVISETEPDDACDKQDNQKLHTEETVSKYNLSKNRNIPEYLQNYDLESGSENYLSFLTINQDDEPKTFVDEPNLVVISLEL